MYIFKRASWLIITDKTRVWKISCWKISNSNVSLLFFHTPVTLEHCQVFSILHTPQPQLLFCRSQAQGDARNLQRKMWWWCGWSPRPRWRHFLFHSLFLHPSQILSHLCVPESKDISLIFYLFHFDIAQTLPTISYFFDYSEIADSVNFIAGLRITPLCYMYDNYICKYVIV